MEKQAKKAEGKKNVKSKKEEKRGDAGLQDENQNSAPSLNY